MPYEHPGPAPARPRAPLVPTQQQVLEYFLAVREYETQMDLWRDRLMRYEEQSAQARYWAEIQGRADARLHRQVAALATAPTKPSRSQRRKAGCQHPAEFVRAETETRRKCALCGRCWQVKVLAPPPRPDANDSLTPGCQACREGWPAWEHIASCEMYARRPESPTTLQRVATWWRNLWS